MSGEKQLEKLIRHMEPVLNPGKYVFCSLAPDQKIRAEEILGQFKEAEGTTIIIPQESAEALQLSYDSVWAWITLKVHSSLEATGLTAAFSTALAKHHIACNVVAGYYHDHLFVPYSDAAKALKVLQELSQTGKET